MCTKQFVIDLSRFTDPWHVNRVLMEETEPSRTAQSLGTSTDMQETRKEIDRIDREVIVLFGQRFQYGPEQNADSTYPRNSPLG